MRRYLKLHPNWVIDAASKCPVTPRPIDFNMTWKIHEHELYSNALAKIYTRLLNNKTTHMDNKKNVETQIAKSPTEANQLIAEGWTVAHTKWETVLRNNHTTQEIWFIMKKEAVPTKQELFNKWIIKGQLRNNHHHTGSEMAGFIGECPVAIKMTDFSVENERDNVVFDHFSPITRFNAPGGTKVSFTIKAAL